MTENTYRIDIKGRVQGVGFRPFVYRLAKKFGLNGWVLNDNSGVTIKVNSTLTVVESFIAELRTTAPVISSIQSVSFFPVDEEDFHGFTIIESQDKSTEVTEISPDIAVCPDCLRDMESQAHRINYPLINCTNCGPRYSIIKTVPYDRPNTSMTVFPMCETCMAEYRDIADRRFHAQPVACNSCGPSYFLHDRKVEINDLNEIIERAATLIHSGKIIALKGVGGYQLLCKATDNEAVARLRKRKKRDSKPFAVMFRNVDALKIFAALNDGEEESLTSWQRPIVLLKQKKELCFEINRGLTSIGAILPYMPFHCLLFRKLRIPALVFTSGNYSNEPIVKDDAEAKSKLSTIADTIIYYNREIENRSDDSIVFHENKQSFMIRRSRGFVPQSIKLNLDVEGILGTGGELKNTFCLGKGNNAILSPYIGDLEHVEATDFFRSTQKHFKELFRIRPSLLAHDLHPNYFTTRFAQESGLECLAVQHHHAHIASVMAEHQLDEKVIGIALDGTGYGTDGKIWGSEILLADLSNFERKFHFRYLPLPGGDQAIKEPWRIMLAILHQLHGDNLRMDDFEFLRDIQKPKKELLWQAIINNINIAESCGAGRYFDAVAALLNICSVNRFEAEAPIRLENIVAQGIEEFYPVEIQTEISMMNMFRFIIEDLKTKVSTPKISAKFHNTIFNIVVHCAENIRSDVGINKVALSGGTFQNRLILRNTMKRLEGLNFEVFTNCQVPMNDGGLSLGQLAIAAKRRSEKCV
ncbi:MAG: carbamoyltransferase HypF [Bacteroidales bacterium]|nr:carbamoyltransferase HypF [Bacteroidales bacterium]MCF8457668.1 carbamoyltransferase HypF [Bacteroidales bacterium]